MTAKADNSPAPADHLNLGRLGDFVGFRLRRIQNQLSRDFSVKSARYELRPGEFSAMELISANPGLSQVMLSREIGLDKSLTVALIDDLEALGLAERRQSPTDRRRHALYTTPKGESVLKSLFDMLEPVERETLNALGPDDLKTLSELLDRMYDACFRK